MLFGLFVICFPNKVSKLLLRGAFNTQISFRVSLYYVYHFTHWSWFVGLKYNAKLLRYATIFFFFILMYYFLNTRKVEGENWNEKGRIINLQRWKHLFDFEIIFVICLIYWIRKVGFLCIDTKKTTLPYIHTM